VHLHDDMAFRFEQSEQKVNASDIAKQSIVKWSCKFLCLKLWGHWTNITKILHNVQKWLLI